MSGVAAGSRGRLEDRGESGLQAHQQFRQMLRVLVAGRRLDAFRRCRQIIGRKIARHPFQKVRDFLDAP